MFRIFTEYYYIFPQRKITVMREQPRTPEIHLCSLVVWFIYVLHHLSYPVLAWSANYVIRSYISSQNEPESWPVDLWSDAYLRFSVRDCSAGRKAQLIDLFVWLWQPLQLEALVASARQAAVAIIAADVSAASTDWPMLPWCHQPLLASRE